MATSNIDRKLKKERVFILVLDRSQGLDMFHRIHFREIFHGMEKISLSEIPGPIGGFCGMNHLDHLCE